eukprot:1861469-Rhodomonas_salina.1
MCIRDRLCAEGKVSALFLVGRVRENRVECCTEPVISCESVCESECVSVHKRSTFSVHRLSRQRMAMLRAGERGAANVCERGKPAYTSAMQCPVLTYASLCQRYAMPGTDLCQPRRARYWPMRCPVLSYGVGCGACTCTSAM